MPEPKPPITLDPELKPWARQPGESGLWYDRFFTLYLPQGSGRTLSEAVNRWRDKEGKDRQYSIPGAWSRNSAQYRWIERAERWDAEQRRELMREHLEEQRRINERHINLGRMMQQVGHIRLQAMLSRLRENPNDPSVNVREVLAYLKEGIAIESKAIGIPDTSIEVRGLSDDELLARYRQLIADLAATGNGGAGATGTGLEDPDE